MDFQEYLEQKEWVCKDEVIEKSSTKDRYGNLLMKWKAPHNYIPLFAIKDAIKEPDVCVGDIHLKEGYIFLMDNREGNWEQ